MAVVLVEQAKVLTPWRRGEFAADGSSAPGQDLQLAFLKTEYPGQIVVSLDSTGQANIPPDPNNYELTIQADQAVMDAIEADPNYVILEGTRSNAGFRVE